jgi:2-polyprenyl-3-methyl-5-hydroxy-6-metoxy-1,4-benzoquinol methylase
MAKGRDERNKEKGIVPKESYDSIKPGYYHHAMLQGSNLQRFWHRNKFRRVIERAGNLDGKRVLDLGCGPGTLISLLPKGYTEAVGLDFSGPQIEFAKKNFRDKRMRWTNKRIEELPFSKEEFDAIFMVEVVEHLPKEENGELFRKICNMLGKEGKFVMTTPNYRSLWPLIEFLWNLVSKVDYTEQHINKYNIPRIRKELAQAGFKEINISTIFFISPIFSIFSPRLAEKIMDAEERLFHNLGSLIVAEAKK